MNVRMNVSLEKRKCFKMENPIYVQFQYENQYPRYQIFKEIGREIYYGRDHFLLWHTICMENNQIILEMVVPKEVTFIICGVNNQEIFTSSNDRREDPFPLLRYQCLAEWKLVKKNYNIIYENNFGALLQGKENPCIKKWLLSLKADYENDNTSARIYNEEKWIANYEKVMKEPEVLHTFKYCGINIMIYRLLNQHIICKRKWYEYYSGHEFVGIEILS